MTDDPKTAALRQCVEALKSAGDTLVWLAEFADRPEAPREHAAWLKKQPVVAQIHSAVTAARAALGEQDNG